MPLKNGVCGKCLREALAFRLCSLASFPRVEDAVAISLPCKAWVEYVGMFGFNFPKYNHNVLASDVSTAEENTLGHEAGNSLILFVGCFIWLYST